MCEIINRKVVVLPNRSSGGSREKPIFYFFTFYVKIKCTKIFLLQEPVIRMSLCDYAVVTVTFFGGEYSMVYLCKLQL